MDQRRRTFALALVFTAIATPAGFAVAQAADARDDALQDQPTTTMPDGPTAVEGESVPASECQEAMEQLSKHNMSFIDSFAPDCPTQEQVDQMITDQEEGEQ